MYDQNFYFYNVKLGRKSYTIFWLFLIFNNVKLSSQVNQDVMELYFKTIDMCEGGPYNISYSNNSITKVGPNQWVWSSSITLPYDITDEDQMDLKFDVIKNGKLIKNFFQYHFQHLCTDLKNIIGNSFKRLMSILEPPMIPEPCPFSKGEYVIRNLTNPIELYPPYFPPGFYRVRAENMHKGYIASCQYFNVYIRKKRKFQ